MEINRIAGRNPQKFHISLESNDQRYTLIRFRNKHWPITGPRLT